MKKDWKKDRALAAKHARLMRRKPELRALMYGVLQGDATALAKLETVATRETAQRRK